MNAALSLLFAILLGQQTPALVTPPTQPVNAPTEPGPGKYQIGPQDLLKVTVLDDDTLTSSYRVDPDGTITMNYIGKVPAAGLTLAQVQEKIRSGLAAGFLRNPQVRVEIESYKSQSVLISGEVRQPGKVTMTGAMTVLEALAAAGSPLPTASSELTVAHAKKPGAEGDAALTRVNWKDLQLGKGLDVALQDGDIVNVPKAQTFYITGQVRNAGNFVLEPGMTVQQAIALAGGLTERGSDRRITASRLVKGKLTDVGLKMEDRVMPNDVITVNQRLF
jgi:polysaccharide export outer membrane protein